MANEEQLKVLKQGVEVWNAWREKHLDATPDLRKADLCGANLEEADLRRVDLFEADLGGAILDRALLFEASLGRADLQGAILHGAILVRADLFEVNLGGADLQEALLYKTDLRGANLGGANLREADLFGANLVRTNLSNANITGARLYGTSRDNWKIDRIKCDYVFWDLYGQKRTPSDRDFEPGEFEELYKSLPTLTYYFDRGFTPLDPLIMDRVVQTINERRPEFELKLTSFDSRGQPHAIFTVIHKDYAEEALKQVTIDYEAKIKVLEGKREQVMHVISMLINNPQIGNLLTDKPVS